MIAKRVPEKVFLQEDLGGGITIGGVMYVGNFNEAVIRGRGTFWSSNKKMEP